MSKAIKYSEISDLRKGIQIFQVIGAGADRGKVFSNDNIRTMHVNSGVINKPFAGHLDEEVLWIYCSSSPVTGDDRGVLVSLRDRGISKEGRIYNFNRFFWTYADAEEFIKELNLGVFSDEKDQKQYNMRDCW